VDLILEQAIWDCLETHPFYGCLLQSLTIKEDRSVGTAGVGFSGENRTMCLFYNAEFLGRLTRLERKAVLIHEMAHVLNLHHLRFAKMSQVINIACDLAVNCYIQNLPEGGQLAENYGFDKFLSAEKYLDLLNHNQEKSESKDKSESQGNDSQDKSDSESQGDSKEESPKTKTKQGKGSRKAAQAAKEMEKGTIDSHEHWQDEFIEKDEQIDITEKILRRAQDRLTASSQAGQLPGNLEEIFADIKRIKAKNWHRILKSFVGKALGGQDVVKTWSRRNRRYGLQEKGQKLGDGHKLLIAFDSSGSMAIAQIESCLQHIKGLVKGGNEGFVCFFDTDVYGLQKLKDSKKLNIKGGGGTCLQNVYKEARKLKVDALVIFTDGDDDGTVTSSQGVPTLMVYTSESDLKRHGGSHSWAVKTFID
jgi:predicted metal-dependent peptidase